MENKGQTEEIKSYFKTYKLVYKAITIIWAFLTILWFLLNVVTFTQPQWIGDTETSPGFGHIGVMQYCHPDETFQKFVCEGSITHFYAIMGDSFKATSIFVGVSGILMMMTIVFMLFFFCIEAKYVFYFLGGMEAISAILMFLAIIIYPSGWNHDNVRELCGPNADKYRLGECSVRWAYIVAILGMFDAAIVAILAFQLGSMRAKLRSSGSTGTLTRSDFNGMGGTETFSKRSIPIQPVVTLPEDEYASVTPRSRASTTKQSRIADFVF